MVIHSAREVYGGDKGSDGMVEVKASVKRKRAAGKKMFGAKEEIVKFIKNL